MTDAADSDLDALLRRHFDADIPDDGFSARVVAALPPRPRQRPWALPLAAAAGATLTWASIAPAPLWQLAADAWITGNAGMPLAVACSLILLLATAACGWALTDTD